MIVKSRGGNVQLRGASTLNDFGISSGGGGSAAGVRVTARSSVSIPAVGSAIRKAAESVAVLELGTWRGRGVDRRRVTTVWQSRLLDGEPNDQQTGFVFKEAVEESCTARGNAFVWLNTDPATGRCTELYALHPDQVLPQLGQRGERLYNVVAGAGFIDPVGRGFGFYTVGPETILHVKGHGDGGMWLAPSPAERYRLALGSGIAKLTHEANMYERGTALRLAVTYPSDMRQEQVTVWRDMWRETYEGAAGATTAVLGGGGQITAIGISMADAQFIESMQFGVEEVARMYQVTVSMLGGGTGNESGPITPEHEEIRWQRDGRGPRLARIEAAFNAHPALFAGGQGVYCMFDVGASIRGDRQTEADITLKKVQSGQWLVDEARALDGLPPLPDGAGQIPQVVPVGGGPNPNQGPPPAPAAQEPVAHTRETVRETVREISAIDVRPEIHLHQASQDITVPAPVVHTTEAPGVTVNVAAAEVIVPAPVTNVTVAPPVERTLVVDRDFTGRVTGGKVTE